MPEEPQIIAANPSIGELGDLHVYVPEGAGPFPFVIGIHGGAWRNGDQQTFRHVWPKVRPLGLGLVLVSYRRRHQQPFPAAYDDLVYTLRWLSENGAGLRLDITRCALLGASAGGHLAMLLAARSTGEKLPSPTIRGVVQYCGIMDLVTQYAHDHDRGATMTHEFLDGTPAEKAAHYEAGSPVAHIHAGMPPVWMAHGTTDKVVPISQSHQVLEKLREHGCEVTFREAGGVGHTFREVTVDNQPMEPWEMLFERDALRFLHRVLVAKPRIAEAV
jgi:acetyl esterase/lipase